MVKRWFSKDKSFPLKVWCKNCKREIKNKEIYGGYVVLKCGYCLLNIMPIEEDKFFRIYLKLKDMSLLEQFKYWTGVYEDHKARRLLLIEEV